MVMSMDNLNTIRRNKTEVYEEIRQWELNSGESFLSYFEGAIDTLNFMYWCLGKGYISDSEFQCFECFKGYCDLEDIIYGNNVFSIIKKSLKGWNLEEYKKGLLIFSEFISCSTIKQVRLDLFLRNITPLSFDEAINEYKNKEKIFYELNNEIHYLTDETELSVNNIFDANWYRDDN